MATANLFLNTASQISKNAIILSNGTTTTSAPTEDIWSRILQEASSKNNKKTQGNVIFLGNDQCGKSSLIFRLTNGERTNFNSVLEYNYLTVQAADPDGSYAYQLGSTGLGPSVSVNLPIWTLDGKEELAPLLKFAFPPQQLAKCAVVLCASLEQPGNILPSLRKWYLTLEEQIKETYSEDEIEQARQAQIRFWKEYVEPIESSMHGDSMGHFELDLSAVEIDKDILAENCGAAVIVVITKSDTFVDISAEQLDKIQYQVRKFCLTHGAALIYTSAKEEKNTQELYKYLAHRVYSLPFTHPAYIVEKDSIFVPSGWDSKAKLGIIEETLKDPDVPILQNDDSILPMLMGTRQHGDNVIEIEDEQMFLNRLASMATNDSGSVGGRAPNPAPKRDHSVGGAKADRNSKGGTGVGGPLQGSDSATLMSFFNKLLKEDSGGNPPNKSQGNTNAADAEAHFQKMLAQGTSQTSNNPPQALSNNSSANNLTNPTQPELDEDIESDISSAGSTLPTPRDAN